jgi:hypothetical protein
MLIVVAMIALISTVPVVVMATSVGQLALTTENLDWNAAYEAAQAGLNDYIEHLDQNSAFDVWTAGNPDFKCSYSPTTAWGYELVNGTWTWVDLKDPGVCGWNSVPNSNNPPEWYEYSIPSAVNGALQLTVSGKAGAGTSPVIRTFTYNIVPTASFLDNIYWTNYEMIDPTLDSTCKSELGIPNGTPASKYVGYASEYASQGPASAWTSGGTLQAGSPQVTGLLTTTGLAVGDTILDTANALPNGTTVTAISGNSLILSNNASSSLSQDTLYAARTALPTSAIWGPNTGNVTVGSNQVTGGWGFTSGLQVGDVVSDSAGDIPGGTVVTQINSGRKFTMSNNATGSNSSDTLNGYWAAYSQQPWPPTDCWIWFAYGDVVNGPTFSNDTLRAGLWTGASNNPPKFYGQVFSAAQGRIDPFNTTSGGTGPTAGQGPEPCEYWYGGTTYACRTGPATGLPPQFQGDEPQPTTASDALAARLVGCYISGGTLSAPEPTWVDVYLTNPSPGVTQLHWSTDPSATYAANVDNASGSPYPAPNPNGGSGGKCGTNGTGGTITVNGAGGLAAALIYVNGNISIVKNPGDPNGVNWDGGFLTIVAGDDNSVGPNEWGGTPNAGDIYIKYSVAYPAADVQTTTTNCSGNPWNGGGGIAAGVCPRTDASDALGLVAQYFVQYRSAPSSCTGTPFTVEAAILALTDSAYVNNWTSGGWDGSCYLDIFGAIGQNFRGPVGTSGPSGYLKEYYYDNSLATIWPPYYLAATSSGWEPVGYAEGKAGATSRALAGVAYASACGTSC